MRTETSTDSENGGGPTLAPANSPLDPLSGTGLVELFEELTRDVPSPLIFRRWTAIHAIGAAVERRVWTQLGVNRLYPNLFLFLISPPGIGKTQALNPMEYILRKSGATTLAPNDVSKQSLLDCLAATTKAPLINERPYEYNFLALHIRELSNFMSQYDGALAGLLTDIFDCPGVNEEAKRGHDKGKAIINPGLSFIMASATQQLGRTIGEDLWGSGFMARVIMVYCADKVIPRDMFAEVVNRDDLQDELVAAFARLGEMKGPMSWSLPARAALHAFRLKADLDAPIHNRLEHYATRRWMHLAKLCMIAALSDERMEVELEDFNTALSWLLTAEAAMPEIFKDMQTHEDGALHEELRSAMYAIHMKMGQPLHESLMFKWLSKRVASHSVERVFAVACAADYFRRAAGEDDMYIPQAPPGHRPTGAI